ncbi:AfsR/SARP family transcriptional regulator [Actinopolyspora sp. H202]|uniref:AfsR/SARP family transcriptional regulator n=1 Tax=Actinopolyspora sp. H202 TaxID=1500456 RepID=UPI003EE71503
MRFGILGPLAVWTADGLPVTVPESKVRVLLATLLVHDGQPVSTDRLCDVLWGDELPRNPTAALQTKVWQLRRTLDDAESGAATLVEYSAPGYLFRIEDTEVDARRFQRLITGSRHTEGPRARADALADAFGLWRGPALADFRDDEFASAAITRFEEQWIAAAEDHAEVLLELGENRVLVGDLADLSARYPLRERLRALRMRALHRAGRSSEALQTFDEFRSYLGENLGVEPNNELVALRQAILQRSTSLDPVPPSSAKAAVSTPGNLPAALTPLIGRDTAVEELRELLDGNRLVTLTGTGGVGKTRLALELATTLTETFVDGVWLVELAPLAPPGEVDEAELYDAVVGQVASTLEIRGEATSSGGPGGGFPTPLSERLRDALRTKRLLLLLDNCEHLVEPVAKLVEKLLQAAPGLRVLATSQDALGVVGEQLHNVPPLVVPDGPERMEEASAVELFVTKASAASPGFRLDRSNMREVLAICKQLDGVPLSLELAATRVRALGTREVAARLANRFELLTVGYRGAPARQQTLRATIDWSWSLLSVSERSVLCRLVPHIGGFTLRAAEQTCADEGIDTSRILDLVARLVDRSLVAASDGNNGRRFHLLESISAYCAERLRESGEHTRVHTRYVWYYTDLAERAVPQLRGPNQRSWLERLDAEAANLRNALDVAVRYELAELGLRLVNALAWYWLLRGQSGEGSRSCSAALTIVGDSTADNRLAALCWRAGFAFRADEGESPLVECDRTWELSARIEDPLRRATARWFLGFAQLGFGDRQRNEARIERALEDLRAAGDRLGVAAALSARATQALISGDLSTAQRDGAESAAAYHALGDAWGQLQAGNVLAQLAEISGDYERSAGRYREGLHIATSLGLWTDVALKLSGLGRVALLQGDYPRARELHERAMRSAAEQGFPFGEQFAEVGLGMGARRENDLDTAEKHLSRWLDWCRRTDGAPGVALILAELGFVAEQRGDAHTALRYHLEGIGVAGRDLRAIALVVEGVAGAVAVAKEWRGAALLLGSAEAARETAGAPLPPGERGDVERITLTARLGTDTENFAAKFQRGRDLAPAQAMSEVLSESALAGHVNGLFRSELSGNRAL